jgi:hypothetical protein
LQPSSSLIAAAVFPKVLRIVVVDQPEIFLVCYRRERDWREWRPVQASREPLGYYAIK